MDTLTVSIAVGLIVSLLFTEMFGLSAGGMIVPGYLALYLHRPMAVVATILVAFATFAAARLLSRYAIIYGRRRIVMMVLIGFLFGALVRTVPLLANLAPENGSMAMDCFSVVGYIIPGLIALWMDRQGWVETLAPLVTSTVVVRLVLIIIGMEMLQ